jgi:hypothetical protein
VTSAIRVMTGVGAEDLGYDRRVCHRALAVRGRRPGAEVSSVHRHAGGNEAPAQLHQGLPRTPDCPATLRGFFSDGDGSPTFNVMELSSPVTGSWIPILIPKV